MKKDTRNKTKSIDSKATVREIPIDVSPENPEVILLLRGYEETSIEEMAKIIQDSKL